MSEIIFLWNKYQVKSEEFKLEELMSEAVKSGEIKSDKFK